MPFFLLSLLAQVALVVHIIKTGRNTIWIWVIIFLPLAGILAYLLVEVLPELLGSRTGRKMSRSVARAVNPDKELKQASANYAITDTVDNSLKLAAELLNKGNASEAKTLYERCLRGPYLTDPYILFGLARAQFALDEYQQAVDTLDKLIATNPDFKNADAHLLYARALEQAGHSEQAMHEYETLHGYYPGPEASFRYAELCQKTGKLALAQQLFGEIVTRAATAGRHYNSQYKTWIQQSKARMEG